MFVVDVPVETSHQFIVALISGEAGPTTSIVTILILHIVGNGLQILVRRTGNVIISISLTIIRTSPTVND